MRIASQPVSLLRVFIASLTIGLALLAIVMIPRAHASPGTGERLITIHDRGKEKGLITKAGTLRKAMSEAHITLDKNDLVEPGLDEKLVSNNYQVNIYRARPVVIVDGAVKQLVMSAYQTPQQIAEHAGITLHDEDNATLELTNNMIRDGASERMVIDRATPVRLTLYGKDDVVYTQAKTVEAFLKDKAITLGHNDTLSVKTSTPITKNMKIEIWHNGKQTVTKEETVAFPITQIQDTDREVGYRKVKTPGVKGKKTVTYEITMKNGKQVKRKIIQTVVTKQPSAQVEIVGAKPSFSGDFAAALAKLRSCEGGYSSWNPAGPYYGAYQFNEGTWNSVSSAPYGNASPAQQDAAAHALYLRRGWSPWPVCAASLPDTYR